MEESLKNILNELRGREKEEKVGGKRGFSPGKRSPYQGALKKDLYFLRKK